LPKEKNDYWLVAVATIFLIIVTLIFLSLMALAIMMLAAQTMTTGV
jgi:triacylglycerol esterase/lipase EstA (alpha/beta hydrolase family)